MGDPLDGLRSLMASHNPPLHAMIVPSEDYHQVNFLSPFNSFIQFHLLYIDHRLCIDLRVLTMFYSKFQSFRCFF